MNSIHDINLEYLKVLNSILSTKSATESAKELNVTQSAVSHSLKKLREILQDELVFREGNSLELTAKAQAIKGPLKKWIEQITSILNLEEFNPGQSQKIFYIATTDITEHLMLPRVIKVLQKEAPGVQLRVLRWEYKKVQENLLSDKVDLAIGVRTFDTPNIMQKVLYEENFISMVRKKHPILESRPTLKQFLSYPHVMTGPGDGRGAVDNYLEKLGKRRELLYTVNSFSSAPALLENSDCILTAPAKFLNYLSGMHKVEIFKTPLKMDPFTLKIYWSKKNHNEASNRWLRGVFYSIAAEIAL